MKIFTASLATETNTFSPVPTDMSSFKSAFYAAPGDHPETPTLCSSVIPVLRRRAASDPTLVVVEGTATWAEPGGLVRQDVYETLRDEILMQLTAAMPVDGVILGLHGAMVARETYDCEGDLLARVREIVGPEVIIAAELDPHSHLTEKRVAASDILATFLEFPHTDFEERAEHVVDMALAAIRKDICPRISTYDCKMIDVFPTSQEPMRSLVNDIIQFQGSDGVLSVSVIHGFMAGDVPEMGTKVLVVTDDQEDYGRKVAKGIGERLFEMRGKARMKVEPLETCVALARSWSNDQPLVIADIWDNPGGGTPGDNTTILQQLIEVGVGRAAVSTIWDPMAAQHAHGAGLNARLQMRIGGKTSAQSGDPIDAFVEVRALADPGWQSFGNSRVTLGRAAVLRIVGTEIDVVVNTNRTQTFSPDLLGNLGVEAQEKDVVVVKSTNHFHAAFAPIAGKIVYCQVDGLYPHSPTVGTYERALQDIWPISS